MRDLSLKRLHALVSDAYLAAGNPSHWLVFLERYRQTFDASCVSFMLWDRDARTSANSFAAGPEADEVGRQYNEYYGRFNPHLHQCLEPLPRAGSVSLSHQRFPVDRLIRTEYYNDYLRLFDLEAVLGAWLNDRGGMSAQISCLRPFRLGLFGDAEVRYLKRLLPHMQRAVQIHSLLADSRLDRRAEVDGLDALHTGVLAVGDSGRVHYANTAAQRLLLSRDGLVDDGAGLGTVSFTETRALRALIAGAARCVRGETLHAGGLIRISRRSEQPPLSVLVAPTSPGRRYPGVPAGCVTVLVGASDGPLTEVMLLMSLYALTPAEGRLAERLLTGQSLAASADQLAISTETARTHLKAIFSKTGTSRQSELVKAAASGVAAAVAVAQRQRTTSESRKDSGSPSRALGNRRAI